MLKRNSGLRQTSSLRQTSCLKNTKTLQAKTNLKVRTSLSACTSLRQESSLKANTSFSKKPGDSRKLVSKQPKKRDGLDELLAMPKRGRVRDASVIAACRHSTCEICGGTAGGEPHHIVSRGAGGPDMEENLIQLCGTCHKRAHSGEISKDFILWIVASRMKIPPEEVMNRIRKKCPH